MLFSASSSLLSPPLLLFSSSIISRSVTLAAEVYTPGHNPCSSINSIQWDLALLFIYLVPLPLFLPELIIFGLLCNSNNFRTVENGPSHTITQYPSPLPPPPPYAPQFVWCAGLTRTVYQHRHWRRAPDLRRWYAPSRRRGNGPTASLK